MIQSATDYIMSVIPIDGKLGIVVFETTSQISANLSNITDTASRERLVDALPPSVGGGGGCYVYRMRDIVRHWGTIG